MRHTRCGLRHFHSPSVCSPGRRRQRSAIWTRCDSGGELTRCSVLVTALWDTLVKLRQHMTTQRDRNLVTHKLLLTATGTRGKNTFISINKLQLMNMLAIKRRTCGAAGSLSSALLHGRRITSRGPASAWQPTSRCSATPRWQSIQKQQVEYLFSLLVD